MEEISKKIQKEIYELVYGNAEDGIVIINDEGNIIEANKAWQKITGYDDKEIKGMSYEKLIPPEEINAKKEFMDHLTEKDGNKSCEGNYIHKDGRKIPVSISISCNKNNSSGAHIEIVSNGERKKMEKSLLYSSKLAAVETLASGVAHEFNNILSVIITWTALIKLDKSDENLKKATENIERGCMRGAKLISSLLDFSKTNRLSNEMININALIDETLNLFKEPLKSNKIKIEKDYEHIPSIYGDKRQLQQVFFHLLSNAKDSLQDMEGKIKIITSIMDEKLKIEFIDNGIGIPEENIDKIFLPFFTTKGALGKSEIPGTGLGLYVSHSIIEQYDGKIEVESHVGRGTKVNVYLPYKNLYIEENIDDKTNLKEKRKKKKGKILLLEDEKFLLKGLKSIISIMGHKVFTARDGESALELLKHEKFDIAFLDIIMEGDKNGLDVFREINSRGDKTEVVLITASSIDEELQENERNGLFRIVKKPFDPEVLTRLIDTILE